MSARETPLLADPGELGLRGRHGYVPPAVVARTETGFENLDAFFEPLPRRTPEVTTDGQIETLELQGLSPRARPVLPQIIQSPQQTRVQDEAVLVRPLLSPKRLHKEPIRASTPQSPSPEYPSFNEGDVMEPDIGGQASETGSVFGFGSPVPLEEGHSPTILDEDEPEEEAIIPPDERYRYEAEDFRPPETFEVDPEALSPPDYHEGETIASPPPEAEEVEPGSYQDDDEVAQMLDDAGIEEKQGDGSEEFEPTLLSDNNDPDSPYSSSSSSESDEGNETLVVPEESELRRTKRVRVPTLAYWRGERIVYGYDGARYVHRVAEEAPRPARKRQRRPPAIGAAGRAVEVNATIFDHETHDFVEATVAKSMDALRFSAHPRNRKVQTARLFSNSPQGVPLNASVMVIARNGMVPTRNSGDYSYAFVTWGGRVQVTLGERSFELQRGGVFEVPPGNDFGLANVGTTDVRLVLVQILGTSDQARSLVSNISDTFSDETSLLEAAPV